MPSKKVTKTQKPKTETKSETVVEPTTVDTTVDTSADTLDNKYSSEFSVLKNHLEMVMSQAKDGLNLLKKLEKSVNKDLKKKKKKVASGFAKPCKISKDLSKFLGTSNDELVARTHVTKCITTYIKDNSLFDPKNKRNIKPDSKLKSLLNYDGITDNQITYFNLQKALKHHFV